MGAERKSVQNAAFRGKRHDNRILKVQILLSRNFVVMAQAPNKEKRALVNPWLRLTRRSVSLLDCWVLRAGALQ